jgi:hypothetical protein
VIRHFYILLQQREGKYLFTHLLFPGLGACVCAYLWFSLSTRAKMVGFVWLAIGLIYLAVLTRGFKEAPKELASLQDVA